MKLFIRDVRSHWGRCLARAAEARGWQTRMVARESQIDGSGYGFVRPHADPAMLAQDKALAEAMARRGLTMIQDRDQLAVYEDKRAQARRWGAWMPETWVFDSEAAALMFAETCDLPVISKADVGSSSQNVRLLENRNDLRAHIWQAFGPGVPVLYGTPKRGRGLQRGYLLLQRFIPHEVTYRVNAVGRQRAAFFRRCYADRPMAQTGNVTPAYGPEDCPPGLLDFAEEVFADIGTRWCALDILRDGDGWRLLETSLAWPHPSPGDCNNAAFWPSGARWEEMWDVLLDEIEAGAWA